MCADCSDHVPFEVAKKLVSPYGVTPDSDDAAAAASFPSPKVSMGDSSHLFHDDY